MRKAQMILPKRHGATKGSGGLFIRLLAALTTLLILPAVTLSGCKHETIAGKGFRFPLSAEPRQIDPQVSIDAASVTMVAALYEGLARLDESGKAVPAAATWKVSDDGLTYTFTLRDSKWSDGSSVTAQDFVFGMQRAVLPSTRSTLAEQLFDIKNARDVNAGKRNASQLGVKATSNKVVVITLAQPNGDFPEKTASTPFMPCKQSFFESTGGRYGLEVEYILTNGPFFLKKWEHYESLLLNKHDGYHEAKNVLPAAVRYMIGEVKDAVKLLTEGNLDAAPIPADALEAAKQAGLTLVTQQDTIRMIWLNNSNAALANGKVRQALRDALEWDSLFAQLNTAIDKPAEGYASPDAAVTGEEKYRTESNARKPQSRGRTAADTLTAGLTQGGLSKMPHLTLLCADDDYNTNLARYIVQSWQKNLSLYFSIEAVPGSELATRVKVGNYQMALYASTSSGSNALDAFGSFVSGAAGNYAHFSDKGYDTRFKAAALGNITRTELESLEAILWQVCPSIPLSSECRFVGIPANDSGIIVRPFGGGVFGAPYDFRGAGKKED